MDMYELILQSSRTYDGYVMKFWKVPWDREMVRIEVFNARDELDYFANVTMQDLRTWLM